MLEYEQLLVRYGNQLHDLSRLYNRISYARLLVVLVMVYLFYYSFSKATSYWPMIFVGFTVLLFILLLRWHNRVSSDRRMIRSLLEINQNEIKFLQGNNPFENGAEYIDHQHLYTFDLDIFGDHSLFQHLNRTGTFPGYDRLAKRLMQPMSREDILLNQQAVAELKPLLSLRQKINALVIQYRDSREVYRHIENWQKSIPSLPKIVRVLMYLLPMLLFSLIVAFAFTLQQQFLNYCLLVFIINLVLLGKFSKQIKRELYGADKIDEILKHYGLALAELEHMKFEAQKLQSIRQALVADGKHASLHLGNLAYLTAQLETINNGLVAMIFSGLGCYHLFILSKLYRWKKRYASHILDWLTVLGDFEVISSLSTFHYNNPDYAMPVITDNVRLSFKDMGHPLVESANRIGNDVDFDRHRFFILTGSNMSGKSTFLRSIGVNIVLAGAGAPVCAKSAELFPMRVLVSMRVADSLADNESYFYAEVKRLKQITSQLQKEGTLVLLDEILRGTNSNDKRNGTLEVIRRMVREGVYGVIATHDLEICKEAGLHPEVLKNICFEVEIRNNELYFDYKLRDGICENQSASFLMEKTGII